MTLVVERVAIFEADRDAVWHVLVEDFADIAAWASGVETSRPDPDAVPVAGSAVGGRICTVPGFGTLHERIYDLDEAAGSFAFEFASSRLPRFLRAPRNRFRVRAIAPGRTEVRTVVTAELDGLGGLVARPWLRRRFARTIEGVLDDLADHLARGDASGTVTASAAASAA